MEHVRIAGDILVTEVEHERRIEGNAAEACFKVQVRTRASTRVTAESDGVAGLHHLVFLYKVLRHVAVDGFQSVIVAYHNVVAVASCLVPYDTHLSAESGSDGVADVHLNVDTLVHASPAAAEVRGHHLARGGHAEMLKVDEERVGQLRRMVGVLVAPFLV